MKFDIKTVGIIAAIAIGAVAIDRKIGLTAKLGL